MPNATERQIRTMTVYVNLPTTLLLVTPFAVLPWGYASFLWMLLTLAGIILAAYLTWSIGAESAPVLSGCLVGFLLANCSIVLATGNAAGLVVSLCTIGTWCLLRNRWVRTGIVCLAISLVMKPHDAGLVWLYFLLAGRESRRRALMTLAVAGALGLIADLVVSPVAPSWPQEIASNMRELSAPGGLNDLSLNGVHGGSLDMKVGLQTILSVFWNDPRIYNGLTYLFCGVFLLIWAVKTVRLRTFPMGTWLALAAVVPITLLVTYHRSYDAKLLLLTVPACSMLWISGRRGMGWTALVLNTAAFVLTGEIPMQILDNLDGRLHGFGGGLAGDLLTIVLMRPISLILVLMALFYLWVYWRWKPMKSTATVVSEPSRSFNEP
ncbi:MAG TPA: glycosyltransferase family 87 protein [Terracidiphilus sp.]|nr:glycosyltransferase family 87 protein [Terracidiphilus sp.]